MNLPPLPGRVSLLTHPVAALVPRWPPATFLLPLRGKNTLRLGPLARSPRCEQAARGKWKAPNRELLEAGEHPPTFTSDATHT